MNVVGVVPATENMPDGNAVKPGDPLLSTGEVHSDVVYGSLEPVTVTDPQSHTYLPDVAANAWDAGVDRSMIPICQDGDNYYLVEEDGTVVLWLAEEELIAEETWESVWHWARDV